MTRDLESLHNTVTINKHLHRFSRVYIGLMLLVDLDVDILSLCHSCLKFVSFVPEREHCFHESDLQ